MNDEGQYKQIPIEDIQHRLKVLEARSIIIDEHLDEVHESLKGAASEYKWIWILVALSVFFQSIAMISQILGCIYGE